jgi:hypothetical protein
MTDQLNKTYPMNHYPSWNGYSGWKDLSNKESDHAQFKDFADARLKKMKDSISHQQDQYVTLTNSLLRNIKTIEYNSLKDSLTLLPAEFRGTSSYYWTVVNEVSKQRPEYYFRLAEDLPNEKTLIFMSVEEEKPIIENLRAVEGHAAIKKEFFKDRRFGKQMLFRSVAIFALFVGGLTLLIATQN